MSRFYGSLCMYHVTHNMRSLPAIHIMLQFSSSRAASIAEPKERLN